MTHFHKIEKSTMTTFPSFFPVWLTLIFLIWRPFRGSHADNITRNRANFASFSKLYFQCHVVPLWVISYDAELGDTVHLGVIFAWLGILYSQPSLLSMIQFNSYFIILVWKPDPGPHICWQALYTPPSQVTLIPCILLSEFLSFNKSSDALFLY